MSELVNAVQNEQAADFQTLVEAKLSVKVGTILRECQAYIASKLFEESDSDSDDAPGSEGETSEGDDKEKETEN